jgi:hypothetical protein
VTLQLQKAKTKEEHLQTQRQYENKRAKMALD